MAGLLCLAASCLPLHAATRTVTLADGTTLTVWEERVRSLRGTEASSIGYQVMDSSGARVGLVEATVDQARDASPCLAIDATGSAVMVWSRFDGLYRKIAYLRYKGGAWSDFHYLTFGPRNDDDPRIGTDQQGSYLFYVVEPDAYMYAPLDLSAGRLFAAPRQVDLGLARRETTPSQRSPVTLSPQGSVDVPVTGVTPPDNRAGSLSTHAPRPLQLSPLGGVDVPVAQPQTRSSIWDVGSSGDCASMILVIPSPNLKSTLVFRFTAGLTRLLKRIDRPPQAPGSLIESLAASELPFVCND